MFDHAREELESEWNAQFDDVRERFASSALDPYHEGYSDYVLDCEHEGEEPIDFDDWKAGLATMSSAPPPPPDYGCDDIPF